MKATALPLLAVPLLSSQSALAVDSPNKADPLSQLQSANEPAFGAQGGASMLSLDECLVALDQVKSFPHHHSTEERVTDFFNHLASSVERSPDVNTFKAEADRYHHADMVTTHVNDDYKNHLEESIAFHSGHVSRYLFDDWYDGFGEASSMNERWMESGDMCAKPALSDPIKNLIKMELAEQIKFIAHSLGRDDEGARFLEAFDFDVTPVDVTVRDELNVPLPAVLPQKMAQELNKAIDGQPAGAAYHHIYDDSSPLKGYELKVYPKNQDRAMYESVQFKEKPVEFFGAQLALMAMGEELKPTDNNGFTIGLERSPVMESSGARKAFG